MIFEVCFEKTGGCPAKTRKILQNVGFCPAKKYYRLASMPCTAPPLIQGTRSQLKPQTTLIMTRLGPAVLCL